MTIRHAVAFCYSCRKKAKPTGGRGIAAQRSAVLALSVQTKEALLSSPPVAIPHTSLMNQTFVAFISELLRQTFKYYLVIPYIPLILKLYLPV